MMCMLHHVRADCGEEPGNPEICDDNHHSEKQDDRVEVNGPVGVLETQNTGSDHE